MEQVNVCSNCGKEFSSVREYKSPLTRLFHSTKEEDVDHALEDLDHALEYDLENYNKIKCPYCGNIQKDQSIKFFGLLNANGLKIIIMVFILAMIAIASYQIFLGLK